MPMWESAAGRAGLGYPARAMSTRSTQPDGLQIRLLGELEVTAHGKAVALPQSRKTRALLGYLALSSRAHRRERLCAVLWDVADDPRAALRWSLSKLRELVDSPGATRLIADREHVSLDLSRAWVDVLELERLLGGAPERAATANLEQARALFRGELLEALELPDFQTYEAWLVAERARFRELHRRVLLALLERSGGHPDKALPLVRELVDMDPADERARAQLLELLHATGRIREAEELSRANRRLVSESPPPPAAALPPPVRRASLDESALVGREAECEQLQRWLSAARSAPGVLLIDGDAGLGKSRLLRELTRRAADGGARVVSSRAPQAHPGWPYAAFRELLQELDPQALAELSPAAAAQPQGREALFRSLLESFARVARGSPRLLIALDDAHALDDASADLLHYLVFGLPQGSDFVLAARGGELQDQQGIARVLRGLRRDGRVEELVLSPFGREQIRQLVASDAADQLYEQSAGNPLFALELARAPEGSGKTLPKSLAQLLRDRVDALAPEQAEVLRWAAVLGAQFEPELLSQLVELPPERFVDTLERLERYGWFQHTGEGASAFAHELVQRAVYAQLSEPRRRLMHTRVARALAARSGGDEALTAALAQHALLGGDRQAAARACLSAGKRCLRVYAHASALGLARRGLAYAAELPDPERTTLTLELHEVSIHARRPAPPEAVASELARLSARALELGAIEHARIGFYLRAFLMWEHGELADARHFAHEVARVAQLADPEERLNALVHSARCLAVLERDLPQAEAFVLEAEAVAAAAGRESGELLLTSGVLAAHRGEYERARAELERAGQLAQRDGRRYEEFFALECAINLELTRGEYANALAACPRLLAVGERLREGSEAPFAAAMHALIRYCSGLEATPEAFELSLEPLALADAKQRRALLLLQAAEFEAHSRRWPAARAHAAEALRVAQWMERHSEAALALCVLIEAAADSGEDASAHVSALRALLERPLSAHARARANKNLK